MDRLFLLLAGCRPIGALPYAPGTWASALTALLDKEFNPSETESKRFSSITNAAKRLFKNEKKK